MKIGPEWGGFVTGNRYFRGPKRPRQSKIRMLRKRRSINRRGKKIKVKQPKPPRKVRTYASNSRYTPYNRPKERP
jgi:hypothetical protein